MLAESAIASDGLVVGEGSGQVASWTQSVFKKSAALDGDRVFALDVREASNTLYGYQVDDNSAACRQKSGGDGWWWLRSADVYDSEDAGIINGDGYLLSSYVSNDNGGVSPAFNLNLKSVIFQSEISHSGSSGHKLTIKDDALNIAITQNERVTKSGSTLTIPYTISGNDAGIATRVSVLVTDQAIADDLTDADYGASGATIKHYLELGYGEGGFATSGTGSFDLPSDFEDGWKVYLLAEDVNDGVATDYASAPVEIEVPSHAHSFSYAASGATVTATCEGAGDCPEGYDANGITLTLAPPDNLTYDGTAKPASLGGYPTEAPEGLEAEPGTISCYRSAGEGSAVPDGGELIGAPTDAGHYVAQATWGGATASLAFTVTKAQPTVTTAPTASGITYGQALASSALAGGEASVAGGFAWADPGARPTVADSEKTAYEVVFTPADAANYEAATCTATLAVARRPLTVTAGSASKAYDGTPLTEGGHAATGLAWDDRVAGATVAGSRTDAGTSANVASDARVVDAEGADVIGSYEIGYVDGTLTVTPASLAKAKVTLSKASYVCDGTAKRPSARVVLGGRELKAGTDYAVGYKDNVNVGTATATVTGKGNYAGSAKATFRIALAKAGGLRTVGHTKKGTLDASWRKVAGAASYELSWREAGGKWSSKTAKGMSATVSGLKKGRRYEVRVRARAGSATGAWSASARRWLKSASSVKASSGPSKGSVKVSWAKDKEAAKGFEVLVFDRKADEKSAGAAVARKAVGPGKTSATVTGLKSGKTYYVCVRPMAARSGATYTGVLCDYKEAKAK